MSRLTDGSNLILCDTRPSRQGAGAAGPVVNVDQGPRQSLGYPKILHTGKETLIAWGMRKPSAKIVTALLKK